MKVIKKDGTLEEYNEQKIINAIDKSAQRENFTFSQDEYGMICNRTRLMKKTLRMMKFL